MPTIEDIQKKAVPVAVHRLHSEGFNPGTEQFLLRYPAVLNAVTRELAAKDGVYMPPPEPLTGESAIHREALRRTEGEGIGIAHPLFLRKYEAHRARLKQEAGRTGAAVVPFERRSQPIPSKPQPPTAKSAKATSTPIPPLTRLPISPERFAKLPASELRSNADPQAVDATHAPPRTTTPAKRAHGPVDDLHPYLHRWATKARAEAPARTAAQNEELGAALIVLRDYSASKRDAARYKAAYQIWMQNKPMLIYGGHRLTRAIAEAYRGGSADAVRDAADAVAAELGLPGFAGTPTAA